MARVLWVGLLVFITGSGQAAETSLAELSDQINQCIDQQFTDGATPAIFEQINLLEECPQLAGTLAGHNEFTATLSPDHDSNNLAELADLSYLLTNIRYPAPRHIALERSSLQAILDDALQEIPQQQSTSWWKEFIDWLFSRDLEENTDADLRWLETLLEKLTLSASTARIILYTSAALITILAVVLIWHEIRLGKTAGWSLFRRRFAKKTREENLSSPVNTEPVNPDTLPANLPILLNICIDYLISTSRLPERKSQTNHEFLNYLQARGDMATRQFGLLCQQAERVLYGDQHPDPSIVERCLREAKSLLSTSEPVESTS